MSAPTTAETPTMRERLAHAAYPEWFGVSGATLANYPGQDKNYQEMALRRVDAILREMLEPSEGMYAAGRNGFKVRGVAVRLTDEALHNGWQAMTRSILNEPKD